MSECSKRRVVTPGTVTLVGGPAAGALMPVIAVALRDDTVTVVPVSHEINRATEWDLLLDADVLGYPAIAQAWNFGSVLAEQCREVFTVVDPEVYTGLQRLFAAAVAGEGVPANLPVGAPVLTADDPRLLSQDADAEVAHRFWEPALTLAGAATLGELVRHRREELAKADAELRHLSGDCGWLPAFERDELDLRRALPARTLGALLRALGLRTSARLRAIARTTVEAGSPSFARGVDDRDVPAQDADAYLDDVFAELEDAT